MIRRIPFIFLGISFLIHVLEEYFFGFPVWASRHFGQTTESFFVASHIPLTIVVLWITWKASFKKNYQFFGMGLSALLFVNGIFHLMATIIFQEYSPGVITGVFLYFPAFFLMIRYCLDESSLTLTQIMKASFVGSICSILIVLFLFLDMPDLNI